MKNDHANHLVDRIISIDWLGSEYSFEHGTSRAWLMREYLRRAALWVQELQKKNPDPSFGPTWSENWPFFDLALGVDPLVHPDDIAKDRLDEFLAENATGFLAGKICRAALNWASLSRESLAEFSHLPDPFEPLILIFERGGRFSIENGFIDFVATRVRLTTWEEHASSEPLTTLDRDTLDALDEN